MSEVKTDDAQTGAAKAGEDVPVSERTLVRQRRDTPPTGRLSLMVIGGREVTRHPLPDSGAISIGRAESNDIAVNDPSVSRRHAVLRLDQPMTLEDFGSANGTRLRGAPLEPGQRVALAMDEPIELGSVLIIVQQRAISVRTRRLWTHDYFEGRLADECARAERFDAEFALVRLHTDSALPEDVLQEVFGRALREIDVFGLYAPGELELLFIDSGPDEVNVPLQRITDELLRRNVRVRAGVACYPRDGRDPDSLVAVACRGLTEEPAGEPVDLERLIVTEGAMQSLHKLVERIASGMLSVLILGETGVGKEVMAETLHRLSPRHDAPFLRLNCAALSESLLESELFGHERGAFTGAVQSKPGLLETAQGGTVFLDELGELALSTQVKLLRVIEARQVLRVGALKSRPIDVRFLAATNRDLEAEIERGNFRQDLYFRLNGITLVIPPLRQRVNEIAGLARAFAEQACHHSGRKQSPPPISAAAMERLLRYSWPGNIRELRNVMERAVLLCADDEAIGLDHLPVQKMKATFSTRLATPTERPPSPAPSREPPIDMTEQFDHGDVTETISLEDLTRKHPPRATPMPSNSAATAATAAAPQSFAEEMRAEVESVERRRIQEALARCAGNQTQAAKLLGISRRTLVNRLGSYELPRPRKGRSP